VTRFLRLATTSAFICIHLSCLPQVVGEPADLGGRTLRLTLLHTSDIHSRLLPFDFNPLKTDVDLGLLPEAGPFGGATRLAALIKRERARAGRSLHLDSGDSFQGAPIFNLNLGEAEYRLLSLLGVDAAVIGNHEFDAGAANFTRQLKSEARFPVLAANYFWEDWNQQNSNQTALYTSPYTVKNLGGLRVGIIGLANISSMNSIIERGNSLQVIPLEQNEVLRNYVDILRPAVDLILVVSHAGLTEDQDLVRGYDAYYEWGLARRFVERKAPDGSPSPTAWTVLEWFGPESNPKSVVRVRVAGVSGVDAILGGHLHIVLNPPQVLTDPSGRKVLLSHGGAFSKYLVRLDAMVKLPEADHPSLDGAEIISHEFKVFPVDALWCNDALHDYYRAKLWNPGEFGRDPMIQAGKADCSAQEDKEATQLLAPYLNDLDMRLNLTSLFSFAPRDIARRNNSSGGDSPLGNITADSMRRRRGVEAEVGLTNSLGIRDNLYAGPLTQESMFSVFPFENTINLMFLSGREMQELFDFVSERSAQRGCVSQAQVSGARFTMDCVQAQLNALKLDCDPGANGGDCDRVERGPDHAPWQCIQDGSSGSRGRCWAHPATQLTISGKDIDPNESYRIAVNDYIARGGSGFLVLKRNTTRVETGIPLRDSLIGFMQSYCTCDDLLAARTDAAGNLLGQAGQPCGSRSVDDPTRWRVDERELSFCRAALAFRDQLHEPRETCTCAQAFRRDDRACAAQGSLEPLITECLQRVSEGPSLGRCSCRAALLGEPRCGNITRSVRSFCENPTAIPLAIGLEDGRIGRRVK
jgi:5'-nucleotidase/UDP-sugar diphosphatase